MQYGVQQDLPAALLRCRGSSRARPYAPEDRGQSTSGTLVLCFAARRSGHKNGLRRRRLQPFSSGKSNVVRHLRRKYFGANMILFKSLRPILWILLFCSIVYIALFELFLLGEPELFRGGNKLGEFLEKLCISYISSLIFYFIVVHYKSYQDKKNVYSYVSRKVIGIYGDGLGLWGDMARVAGMNNTEKLPPRTDVGRACQAINLNTIAPLSIGSIANKATWIQYLAYYQNRTRDSIRGVLLETPYLEAKLLGLLAEIEDCTYFRYVGTLNSGSFNQNTDLSFLAPNICDYFDLLDKLQTYAEEKLKPYADEA